MEWKTLCPYHGPYKLYEWPGYQYPEAFITICEDEEIVVRQHPPNPPEEIDTLVTHEWWIEPTHVLVWSRFVSSLNLASEPYNKAPPRGI